MNITFGHAYTCKEDEVFKYGVTNPDYTFGQYTVNSGAVSFQPNQIYMYVTGNGSYSRIWASVDFTNIKKIVLDASATINGNAINFGVSDTTSTASWLKSTNLNAGELDVSDIVGVHLLKFELITSSTTSATYGFIRQIKFTYLENMKQIYSLGSWAVPYDNPGDIVYPGITVNGATLSSNEIQFVSISNAIRAIGTANKIDLTDYTMLKVNGYDNSGNSCVVGVYSSKDLSTGLLAETRLTSGSAFVENVLDITDIEGEQYIVVWTVTSGRVTAHVNRIWLQ